MRLLVMSDIHLESESFDLPEDLDFDVAIFAGDTWKPVTHTIKWLSTHPRRLLAECLNDDEAVEYLLTFGFDLRSERGSPLRSTMAIAIQVEAAARGLAGRLPDRATIDVETFEAGLAAEAAAFMSRKRARSR